MQLHGEREQFEYTQIHSVIYHPSVFLIKTTTKKAKGVLVLAKDCVLLQAAP